MIKPCVLIVEDDSFIATDVEHALIAAGYDVCGVAATETEALEIARQKAPQLAVIDVNLAPGDGRHVAKELAAKYNTTILMATAEDPETLNGIGAAAVLPKPYDSNHVAPALKAVEALAGGAGAGRHAPRA